MGLLLFTTGMWMLKEMQHGNFGSGSSQFTLELPYAA
jgi:hypothetical protein